MSTAVGETRKPSQGPVSVSGNGEAVFPAATRAGLGSRGYCRPPSLHPLLGTWRGHWGPVAREKFAESFRAEVHAAQRDPAHLALGCASVMTGSWTGPPRGKNSGAHLALARGGQRDADRLRDAAPVNVPKLHRARHVLVWRMRILKKYLVPKKRELDTRRQGCDIFFFTTHC